MTDLSKKEEELERQLSVPSDELINLFKNLEGDIIILGVGGKMGITLAMTAYRAVEKAGSNSKVIGVSRFSSLGSRERLEKMGISTIACDLLDSSQVSELPRVKNVIFMVGRKFGTQGSEDLTWAINTLVPGNVCRHFSTSRIVAFSTGCVYPLFSPDSKGCTEETKPAPVGEYAQSSLGRERIFQFYSRTEDLSICLFRLNYAIDLRYGVLHDIASCIAEGKPVDLSVPCFNIIWQGDANNIALLCLAKTESPAKILNVTGQTKVNTENAALKIGKMMNKKVKFKNRNSGKCYLSDASKSKDMLSSYPYSDEAMIEKQVEWIMSGGSSLGKPTHFEINNGKF
ncbi:MAG: NAD-dependent epimerase/dehydratase family protein [Verrucomicrobiota bacterium]|nr:NAD-dependent epimerase/dehydratase family protein [Verrucomicrobiota bacterium]